MENCIARWFKTTRSGEIHAEYNFDGLLREAIPLTPHLWKRWENRG